VASTYEPIASQTLGADAASVTFSAIAATWTDLRLIVTGRTDWTTDEFEALGLRFNSDTGSNYSHTVLLGNGSAASSSRLSSNTSTNPQRFNPSHNSNTSPAVAIVEIMSYSNTNVFKTVLGASAASAENFEVARGVGLWQSTSAITSVTLIPIVGSNFKSGLTASLYGIKAA
jgi:hypothetical protein